MSTYYEIGCEKCREAVSFVSDAMSGFALMGGAAGEVPKFIEKHVRMGCVEHLRVFSEHDYRSADFEEFDASKPWDVEP